MLGAVFFAVTAARRPGPPAELKVLSKADRPITAYDPANPRDNSDFFYLENLFSPLVEYSSDGSLVSGAAESFFWDGSTARFRMRAGLATASGRQITAHDAALSLKRLFVLGGEKYSFLSVALCGAPPASMSAPCPGLRAEDSGRSLAMEFPEQRTYLFRLLANINYSVIPVGSFDQKTLRLTNYRETSGPYFADSDGGGGKVNLKANPRHYRYSPAMPLLVAVTPVDERMPKAEVFRLVKEGAADYLTISLVRKPEDKLAFSRENRGYSVHLTRPLRLLSVVFTPKGRARLTREERFFIASRLRGIYLERNLTGEPPAQIFHLEGQLSRGQAARLREALAGNGRTALTRQVAAYRLYNYFPKDGEAIKKWLPGVVYADRQRKRSGRGPAPDFRIFSGEIGLQDDMALVLHYLDSDFFGLGAAEKKAWRRRYLSAADKRTRMDMLRELQFETMMEARTLPVGLMPYASLARGPWKFDYPEAIAGDQLWRLRRTSWTRR